MIAITQHILCIVIVHNLYRLIMHNRDDGVVFASAASNA